jgi:hypothetical protein
MLPELHPKPLEAAVTVQGRLFWPALPWANNSQMLLIAKVMLNWASKIGTAALICVTRPP